MDDRCPRRACRFPAALVLALLAAAPAAARAQGPVASDIAPEPWSVGWIIPPEAPGDSFGVYHFRRTFTLPQRPERFLVHVSADNRYRLLVNGAHVASGPARSDLAHWHYETLDLAPYLVTGRNVLAAEVWNYGPHRPIAQHSYRTAFLLRGDGEAEAVVNSGPEWKVVHDPAYRPVPVTGADVRGYYAATPGEAIDARAYPWGWERLEFDDSAWPAARPFAFRAGTVPTALPRGSHPFGEMGGWQLVPRPIPQMEERVQRIPRLRRAEGVPPSDAFLRGAGDLVIPANTRAVLVLDQTFITNAYPVVEASGGRDATLTMTFTEAAVDSAWRKGHRDEIEGRAIHGVRHALTFDGGERRRFVPLSFRTFRYIQMEVETRGEPLRLHDVHGIFTGYPLQERGGFSSDLPWLEKVWEMNWRTLRICAWETYFDTPYYEQLQYVGDTRTQALITLYVDGDDRLVRHAIRQFDQSRIPEGLTQSRYPSYLPQFIPPYSLLWVAMVHDYWMLRDDPAFLRRLVPGTRMVLSWFQEHMGEDGLLGPLPWWNIVDSPAFEDRGVPPGAMEGGSVLISLQYAYALRKAADLEEAFGEPALARRYHARADSLGAAARAQAWDARRGLLADTPEKRSFSEHTNVMAVLADAVPESDQRALMERVLADGSLIPAALQFRIYVDEALHGVGLGDRYIDRLEPWREMVEQGLTTTPEFPGESRSDSHAWSAHPNYSLLATVIGVRPAAPGFGSVRIAPALGTLRRAQGKVAHPAGTIEVQIERSGAAGVSGVVSLPAGVSGTFEWNGRTLPLRPGRQNVAL